MRAWLVLCLTLVSLPSRADPDPPAQNAQAPTPPAAAAPTENKTPENVRTVTIDPNARPPVCRRVVPTGSRIAEQRCESPKERTSAADEADRAILRHDFEAMRELQRRRAQRR